MSGVPLTEDQRAEIRRRAQAEFVAPPRKPAFATVLAGPGYHPDDFDPDPRSVDRDDPVARVAPVRIEKRGRHKRK